MPTVQEMREFYAEELRRRGGVWVQAAAEFLAATEGYTGNYAPGSQGYKIYQDIFNKYATPTPTPAPSGTMVLVRFPEGILRKVRPENVNAAIAAGGLRLKEAQTAEELALPEWLPVGGGPAPAGDLASKTLEELRVMLGAGTLTAAAYEAELTRRQTGGVTQPPAPTQPAGWETNPTRYPTSDPGQGRVWKWGVAGQTLTGQTNYGWITSPGAGGLELPPAPAGGWPPGWEPQYNGSTGAWELVKTQGAGITPYQQAQLDLAQAQLTAEGKARFEADLRWAAEMRAAREREEVAAAQFAQTHGLNVQQFQEAVRVGTADLELRKQIEAFRQDFAQKEFAENKRRAAIQDLQIDRQFEENKRQFGEEFALRQRQLAQQSTEFQLTHALASARYQQDITQAGLDEAFRQAQLAQQASQFARTYGLDVQQFQEVVRQAQVSEGFQRLSLEMQQTVAQFNREQATREFGLTERRFEEQKRAATVAETLASDRFAAEVAQWGVENAITREGLDLRARTEGAASQLALDQFRENTRQYNQDYALQQAQLAAQQQRWTQEFGLAERRFGEEQRQFQVQEERRQKELLAEMATRPESWLEFAALSGRPPVVQPWMLPLMPQDYPQFQGVQAGQVLPGWPIPQGPPAPPTQGAMPFWSGFPPGEAPPSFQPPPSQGPLTWAGPPGPGQPGGAAMPTYLGPPPGEVAPPPPIYGPGGLVSTTPSQGPLPLKDGGQGPLAPSAGPLTYIESLGRMPNMGDVTKVQRIIMGLDPLPPGVLMPNMGDVTKIERIILGIDPLPPPRQPQAPRPLTLTPQAPRQASPQPVGQLTPIPGWQLPAFGQPLSAPPQQQLPIPTWNLPALTTPGTQYQARMGPTALAQYGGYEQARTGATPQETAFRLASFAPPRGWAGMRRQG